MIDTIPGLDGKPRCKWCAAEPEFFDYHDKEWGFPVVDDVRLFEKLCLESFQSGLSWRTILAKRENFRAAFQGFDPKTLAGWGEADVTRLLADAGIVRHRGKIEGTIAGAQAYLRIEAREGFAPFLWKFVNNQPIQTGLHSLSAARAESPESRAMSKALKAEGFKFCGPTITYAFQQATGMVNDHLVSCPWHAKAQAEG